jgi:hypothetical protein
VVIFPLRRQEYGGISETPFLVMKANLGSLGGDAVNLLS